MKKIEYKLSKRVGKFVKFKPVFRTALELWHEEKLFGVKDNDTN